MHLAITLSESKEAQQTVRQIRSFLRARFTSFSPECRACFNWVKRGVRLDKRRKGSSFIESRYECINVISLIDEIFQYSSESQMRMLIVDLFPRDYKTDYPDL